MPLPTLYINLILYITWNLSISLMCCEAVLVHDRLTNSSSIIYILPVLKMSLEQSKVKKKEKKKNKGHKNNIITGKYKTRTSKS